MNSLCCSRIINSLKFHSQFPSGKVQIINVDIFMEVNLVLIVLSIALVVLPRVVNCTQNIFGLGPFILALLTCTSSAFSLGMRSLAASRLRTARNWLTSFLISCMSFMSRPLGSLPSDECSLYYAISSEACFACDSILLNLATAITFARILAIFSSC